MFSALQDQNIRWPSQLTWNRMWARFGIVSLIPSLKRIDQNQQRLAGLSLMGGSFHLCRRRHSPSRLQSSAKFCIKKSKAILNRNTRLGKTWHGNFISMIDHCLLTGFFKYAGNKTPNKDLKVLHFLLFGLKSISSFGVFKKKKCVSIKFREPVWK